MRPETAEWVEKAENDFMILLSVGGRDASNRTWEQPTLSGFSAPSSRFKKASIRGTDPAFCMELPPVCGTFGAELCGGWHFLLSFTGS
jgi:hypothetical protein